MLETPIRRRRRTLVAGGIALSVMLLAGSAVAVAATKSVAISGFAFSPKSLTINVGDRVTWKNSDSVAHTATATGGAFDTGTIEPGSSASVRFTKAGTYRYACTPHPTMTGTIRVRASSGGGATIPPTDTIEDAGAAGDSGPAGAALAALVLFGVAGLFAIPRRFLRRG
jgi:plastocyanin